MNDPWEDVETHDKFDQLRAQLAEREARVKHLEDGCIKSNDDICQTLGKALKYPWFKDDQKNFPGATEENGVCVGDHVAESIAMEAARVLAERDKTIERLRAVNERDRTQVAIGINAVIEAIRKREWLRLGRGSYEWNDDRWMDEFGQAIDEIQAALNELREVSLDHSDCPVSREDVLKARAALKEEADEASD